jgi:hypothetical protein
MGGKTNVQEALKERDWLLGRIQHLALMLE